MACCIPPPGEAAVSGIARIEPGARAAIEVAIRERRCAQVGHEKRTTSTRPLVSVGIPSESGATPVIGLRLTCFSSALRLRAVDLPPSARGMRATQSTQVEARRAQWPNRSGTRRPARYAPDTRCRGSGCAAPLGIAGRRTVSPTIRAVAARRSESTSAICSASSTADDVADGERRAVESRPRAPS